MNRIFLLLALSLVIESCGSDSQMDTAKLQQNNQPIATWQPPAAGTVIEKVEEKIDDDKLNNSYFRVVLEANAESKNGNYTLKLEYGFNKNETTIDLPKWNKGVTLKPVLKKGSGKYECELGFDAGDGVFKEFYQIKVENKNIKLKQVKGYFIS